MARYNTRSETRAAAARAIDNAWNRAAEHALDACEGDFDQAYPRDDLSPYEDNARDSLLGADPMCRFVNEALHTCTRRDGRITQPGDVCWREAAAQVAEQGAVLHGAEVSL